SEKAMFRNTTRQVVPELPLERLRVLDRAFEYIPRKPEDYPFPLNSLRSLLLRFGFGNTGPAKNRRDHRIAFMARRLVYRPFCFRPGNLRGPWLGPSGGIFYGELISHRVVRGARETFDEVQLFAGSSEIDAIHEIGGVDHQCSTLPMPHRVSLP